MNESFVGHEARFSLPCNPSVVPLLMGFIEELLMVGGSEVEAPDRVEEQIRVAIDEICHGREGSGRVTHEDDDTGPSGELQATLSIVVEGIEVTLATPHDGRELPSILVREQ